jgi:HEAT repeat protein
MNFAKRLSFPVYCLLAAACSLPAAAQEPHVVNARMRTLSATAGLAGAFHSIESAETGPAWIGYAVPIVPGNHRMCCNGSISDFSEEGCGRCRLEDRQGENGGRSLNPGDERGVKLESPLSFLVLYRATAGKVLKIRTFSPECELDAGGLPLIWLTEVRPADSVAWLSSFVKDSEVGAGTEGDNEGPGEEGRLSNSALTAIALHADASAERALEGFVAAGQPEPLREHAAFWLGAARGRQGYEALRRLLQDDPSEHFREKAVFALYVSKEPEAVDAIIGVAHHDPSAQVRGQALFWLAQKAGKKAAATITEAIENDPETDVKKRAVFALSQLPKDEGVPLLIQVARTSSNAVVRKQAMFWLGQSKDPRALAFFEQILGQ